MTTSTPSSTFCPPNDLPIIVRDHRRRGFFLIDNIIIDQYGPQLKAYGVAVYNVLSRFANREGVCFPSQATIAKRLDMSRMQVSREIDKLKRLRLIEVHPQFGPQGEQRANLYILLDVPEEEAAVTHRYTPGNSQLHPPVTGSDTPCNSQLHKQDPENKTHKVQDPEEQQPVVVALHSPNCAVSSKETGHRGQKERIDPPAPTAVMEPAESDLACADRSENNLSAAEQASAAALIAIGLAETVAHQLADCYSPPHIAEKIEYLAYLQAKHPEQVLKPCGWLRRAIEQNYAAPDGYRSTEERAIDAVERQRHEAETQRLAQEQLHEEEAERERQQEAADRLTHLHTLYGTTQQELDLWKLLLQEFKLTLPAASFALYVADTVLLSLKDGEALISLPTLQARDWLENRFASKIQRALASCLDGQKVSVKFVDLTATYEENRTAASG